MDNPILNIAKSSSKKNSWFVIDPTWGVKIKFAAKTQKECIEWCKSNKYDYRKGFVW